MIAQPPSIFPFLHRVCKLILIHETMLGMALVRIPHMTNERAFFTTQPLQ